MVCTACSIGLLFRCYKLKLNYVHLLRICCDEVMDHNPVKYVCCSSFISLVNALDLGKLADLWRCMTVPMRVEME